jgi:hypothetical protein
MTAVVTTAARIGQRRSRDRAMHCGNFGRVEDSPTGTPVGTRITRARRASMRRFVVVAFASAFGMIGLQSAAATAPDLFQQAVNYVFTGRIDPQSGPEIVDRNACIIVMRDPKFERFIRYYLARFKMDTARFTKKYAGTQTLYELDVEGDAPVIEYLAMDKTTIVQGYKSAQIPLLGNIDQTQKALQIITKHCAAAQPKSPFG